ncbi:D-alanyl-D-alanine carboxypeptidase (penicillin-binding protein 5/6) [Roseibium hamelinense]|uniref:serine-type D-Ala-D-Ala carboxypeptidase n=1 Tax=Roseibium hamelinense TaxID=150831 RepID=A0A562TH94_9HYPH|nr:D-alanyl-D-alanine carboxypeptidase family protein [Roseibium hamelinense]MTI45833.1 D-alanyl-D-alanine carboxypeptidase [Roseibium hamelinense]TWI92985.1 D-alanyl-D-alanine carboxypeptidase (penicillin-binding protein 5/6) [Roseibium hamelinense]
MGVLKRLRQAGLAAGIVFQAAVCAATADTLSTSADIAILTNPQSGTTLYAKEADTPFAPGSLAKVMTAAVVFEALNQVEVSSDQNCTVSEHAWRTGGAPSRGATMFAAIKSDIPVEDLLRGLLIHNANDAAIILGECLSGTEAGFAARMTAFGETIGMTATRFMNPTGYEMEGAQTTARDLSVLASYILKSHPDRYALFSEPEFTWNNIFQRNKNPLIGEIRNLDGLGAGQSEQDGFAGLASVERNGLRVVAVVAGLPSVNARLKAMREVIEGAWDFFTIQTLYQKGDVVAEASVFGGEHGTVPLIAAQNVDVLLPRGGTLDYRLRVVYDGPLEAPVSKGMPAGELRVVGQDGVVHTSALQTGAAVQRGSLQARAIDGLAELLFGWL